MRIIEVAPPEYDLTTFWADFVEKQACSHRGHIRQLMKFIQAVSWKVPGDVWSRGMSLTFPDMDYNERSKMGQLDRTYYNRLDTIAAREKLISRMASGKTQSSVAITTINGEKHSESQGHCMRAIVITHFSKAVAGEEYLTVDVLYRSTELVKKFGADLMWLSKKMIPELTEGINIPIKEVRFYFSNLFVSGLFLPIIYNVKNPVQLLESIRINDLDFFKKCMFQTKTLINTEYGHYAYKTRRKMHHLALQLMDKGIINKNEFAEYIKQVAGDIPDTDDQSAEEDGD